MTEVIRYIIDLERAGPAAELLTDAGDSTQ